MLSAPAVTASFGLWPFVVAQLVLLWFWYALHGETAARRRAQRLGVTALALIYALAIVLLPHPEAAASDARADRAPPGCRPRRVLMLPFVFLFYIVTGPIRIPQFGTSPSACCRCSRCRS